MQTLASITNQGGKASLNIEVNILKSKLPIKLTRLDLTLNLCHSLLNIGQILGANDFLGGQHLSMG